MKLPSDSIKIATGLRDDLPQSFARKGVPGHLRLSIAVNTHYAEVSGGYYVNARVLCSIEAALQSCGLAIVNPEYLGGAMCPNELLAAIENDTVHLLMGSVTSEGLLEKWAFDTGGGGTFFSDDLIVDILLPSRLTEDLERTIRERCRLDEIATNQRPENQAGAKGQS